jgi:hypothetical protein
MPPLTLDQTEARLQDLARYIGTTNYMHVEEEINRLLDQFLVLKHEPVLLGKKKR